jgi:U3 small nucleolar ribonucleoprotein component
MKNFENKEGYYEELMQIIYDAIAKARKTLNHNEFTNLIKALKYYLRSTLSSIYLIKIS